MPRACARSCVRRLHGRSLAWRSVVGKRSGGMGKAAARIHPPTHSLSPPFASMSTTFASSSAFSAASFPHLAASRSSCSIAGVDAAAYEQGGAGSKGRRVGWVRGHKDPIASIPPPRSPRTAPYRRHVCRESAPKRPPSTEPGSFPARRVDPSTVAHSAEPVHHCKTPGPRARARAPAARAAAIRSARELTPHWLHAHDRRSSLASRAAPPRAALVHLV